MTRISARGIFVFSLAMTSAADLASPEAATAQLVPVPDDLFVEPPILTLDTPMIAGSEIRAMAISHDDRLLAVGANKEVRLWDIQTGRLVNTLRGYREPDGFNIGNVNTVAFTPDNRYLIVGVTDNTDLGSTRIYDLTDPNMSLRLLPGHTGCTLGAATTSDGRFIATFGCFIGLKMYEINMMTGETESRDIQPTREDKPAMHKPEKVRQWASYFGFPLENDWILQQSWSGRIVSHRRSAEFNVPQSKWPVELSEFCDWEDSLKPPQSEGEFTSDMVVRLKSVRGYVRGGMTKGRTKERFWIGVWNIGQSAPKVLYTQHRYSPSLIAWSPSGQLIASSDGLGDVHVWHASTGDNVCKLMGDNASLYGVEWIHSHQVRFSDTHFDIDKYDFNHYGPYTRTFNLQTREFGTVSPLDVLPRDRHARRTPQGQWGKTKYRLEPRKNDAGHWMLDVNQTAGKDKKYLESIQLNDSILSYVILEPHIFVGTETGSLEEFDLTRKTSAIRRFRGHTGMITGLAVSADERILASSSTDGTIRFWNLAAAPPAGDIPFRTFGNRIEGMPGRPIHENNKLVRWELYGDPEPLQEHDLLIQFDGRSFYERKRSIAQGLYVPGQEVELLVEREGRRFKTKVTLEPTPAIAEPLLTVFLTRRSDWIAWTPAGKYDASSRGEPFVGWHVNQGREFPAKFFQVGQFRQALYRPDEVAAALNRPHAVQKPSSGQPTPLPPQDDFEAAGVIQRRLPPEVRILTPAPDSDVRRSTVRVEFEVVSSEGLPEQSATVSVNGRPIADPPLVIERQDQPIQLVAGTNLRRTVYAADVPVSPGRNVISVRARHNLSESNLAQAEVEYRTAAKPGVQTRRLFIFAVGISVHRDPSWKLDAAHRDAIEFEKAFRSQEDRASLFTEVHSRVLTDEQATVKNIKEGMGWLSDEATEATDTAFVFLSGHALFDKHRVWRYLTHDVAPGAHLDSTTLTFDEIRSWFESRVPAQAVLFVDSCHASAINGGKRKGASIDPRPNPWQGTGRLVFSSSLPDEESLELDRHGAFTQAILEALSQPAMSDALTRDGYLSVDELSVYLKRRVPVLTNGLQHPTLFEPGTLSEVLLYQFREQSSK